MLALTVVLALLLLASLLVNLALHSDVKHERSMKHQWREHAADRQARLLEEIRAHGETCRSHMRPVITWTSKHDRSWN